MTVQEIMERTGIKETNITIAWIKDAIHLIQSNYGENLGVWKTNITDGTSEYPFPANLIKLKSVSVKDTTDSKYKRIKRIIHEPVMTEDTDPE